MSTSTPRKSMLDEVRKLAEGPLAESFADADRNPPVFDPETHSVTLPESFKKSYHAYTDAGWDRLGLPHELGGPGLPPSIIWAGSEMVIGANPAIHMYAAGPGLRADPAPARQRRPAASSPQHDDRAQLGRHDGPHRARRRLRRRRRSRPRRPSSPTAPGTSRASSASSPAPSGTSPRTSFTSCSPGPRAPAPAPRACRCSSYRSSTSTSRPASSASATAPSSPTSRRRWA